MAQKHDRIFTRDGRRHFRRSYSLTEVRWSLVVFGLLGAILAWVIVRGMNPDPTLFALDPKLLSKPQGVVAVTRDSPQVSGLQKPIGHSSGQRPTAKSPATKAGPIPALADKAWRESKRSTFSADDMYKKINGRAGYYRGFGCRALHTATLLGTENDALAIDLELYDLATNENALGAYAGERSPTAKPVAQNGGLGHIDRNALYLVRGKYYLRAIGPDESAVIKRKLTDIRARFDKALAAGTLPWAYELFGNRLKLPLTKLAFRPTGAFSLEFARDVYLVEVDEDGAAIFATLAADAERAKQLAKRFRDGFASLGKSVRVAKRTWAEDRFQKRLSTATNRANLVVGVYSAANAKDGGKWLDKLLQACNGLAPKAPAKAKTDTAEPSGESPSSPESEYNE